MKPNELNELKESLAKALIEQGTGFQAIIDAQRVEIEKMKAQIDSMPKRLEDMFDALLKQLQVPQAPQGAIMPSGGAGWMNMLPEVMKAIGIGTPANSLDADLQNVFQDQFKKTTLNLWKRAFTDLNRKMGITEHVVTDGMHLS